MKIICVTDRLLCKNNFFEQIEFICTRNIYGLILREKDLDDNTYEEFAVKCNNICKRNNVLFFINTKINIAQKLKIKNIQLSFKDFSDNKKILNSFDNIAVSVHSLQEATVIEDWSRGNKPPRNDRQNLFLIAGHIFETDCKKGIHPRGTKFLKEICNNINVPVFAIGGINKKTIHKLKNINIEGVCLMSALMKKNNDGNLF